MKLNKSVFALIVATSLSGCTNLKDVDVSWCDTEPKTEVVNLAADALFRFNEYSQDNLLPKGRKLLDELVVKLQQGYVRIGGISLVGHTDRLGSPQYNYTLGLNRAKTVRAYLQGKGLNAAIKVSSEGEKMPVTDGCYDEKGKAALVNCLQPDRRVVISITGIKKVRK